MPLSERARAGLSFAVRRNPHGARFLLAVLREHSAWVKYKDDRYGPLAAILSEMRPTRRIGWLARTEVLDVDQLARPLPADVPPDLEIFGREWRQRRFSKRELADEIEMLLADVPRPPAVDRRGRID